MGPSATSADVHTVQDMLEELCARQAGGLCVVTVGRDGDFEELADAVDFLLAQDPPSGCICILPGENPVTRNVSIDEQKGITIHGCGPGSVLVDQRANQGQPLIRFAGCTDCRVSDLAIQSAAYPAIIEASPGPNQFPTQEMVLENLSIIHTGARLIPQAGPAPLEALGTAISVESDRPQPGAQQPHHRAHRHRLIALGAAAGAALLRGARAASS